VASERALAELTEEEALLDGGDLYSSSRLEQNELSLTVVRFEFVAIRLALRGLLLVAFGLVLFRHGGGGISLQTSQACSIVRSRHSTSPDRHPLELKSKNTRKSCEQCSAMK